MLTQEPKRLIEPQNCPLCNEPQDVIINGHRPVLDGPGNQVQFDKKLGYSFCNCRNIFFTNWKNINQGVYDPEYHKKYDNAVSKHLLANYIRTYQDQIIESLNYKTYGKAIEIGCVAPDVLDGLANLGMKTYGLDIVKHDFGKHESVVADFEDYSGNNIKNRANTFQLIWASHIFEHFRFPIQAVRHCNKILEPGGLLFVAMPDPYFIDWKSAHLWGHWHINEHHILWDMESFAKVLEEEGFEIIFQKHNIGYEFICIGDFHILARKVS